MANTKRNADRTLKYPIIMGRNAEGSDMPLYRAFPRTVTGLWNVTKPVDSPDAPSITYMGEEPTPKPQTTLTGEPIISARGLRLPSVNVKYYFKGIPMIREAKQHEMCKIAKELNKLRTTPAALKILNTNERIDYYTELLYKK